MMFDGGGIATGPAGDNQRIDLNSDTVGPVLCRAVECQKHLVSLYLGRFGENLTAFDLQCTVGDLVEQRGA